MNIKVEPYTSLHSALTEALDQYVSNQGEHEQEQCELTGVPYEPSQQLAAAEKLLEQLNAQLAKSAG